MSIAEKLTEVARNVPKVYEAGKNSFWISYQQEGNRTDYGSAFGGKGWTKELFCPKYDIHATDAYMMFRIHGLGVQEYDLAEHLENLGIVLDFSACTKMGYAFYQSGFVRIGVVDCSAATALENTFAGATKLVTIDKLVVHKDLKPTGAFNLAESLQDITVEGIIGQNGWNFQWSTGLNRESMESILQALSTDTSGLTITLSLEAVNKAFETAEGALDGSTSQAWTELLAGKNNWTVALV